MEIDSPTQEIHFNFSMPGACDRPDCQGHAPPPFADIYDLGVRALEFADCDEQFHRLSVATSYAECIAVIWLTVEVELDKVTPVVDFFTGIGRGIDHELGDISPNDTLAYEHLHAPIGSRYHV